MDRTEERLAHLLRAVEDLSELAALQAARIDRLEARVAELRRAEAERQADSGGGVTFGDERPPHW
ncbi:MAG: SlyX family protein [Rhodobacteraceae bacterium]|nr:SlyX family protein [Paracoccaceae bacterium]